MNDKVLHAVIGILALLGAAGALWLHQRYGAGAAAAAITTALSVGIELYQRVRHEGTPDWRDAFATAAPGWIYWLTRSF